MTHKWLIGALAGVMLAGSAAAQTPPKPTTPAPSGQPPSTAKPQPPSTAKPQPPSTAKPTTPTAPSGTPTTQRPAATAEVPSGETVLGTVSIPRAVTADGKPLPAGRYTVRLTAQTAQPTVAGQVPDLNRWVEFVQGGNVRGREVVSIVPAEEVDDTQQGPDLAVGKARVGRGSSRVETLKGNEYVRVWINRGGNNYLVHLVPSGGGTAK